MADWRLADLHGMDMSNVSVSMNKDKTRAERCQRKRHEEDDGKFSENSVLSSGLRVMPGLRAANAPQTRLLHVVCKLMLSSVVSDVVKY